MEDRHQRHGDGNCANLRGDPLGFLSGHQQPNATAHRVWRHRHLGKPGRGVHTLGQPRLLRKLAQLRARDALGHSRPRPPPPGILRRNRRSGDLDARPRLLQHARHGQRHVRRVQVDATPLHRRAARLRRRDRHQNLAPKSELPRKPIFDVLATIRRGHVQGPRLPTARTRLCAIHSLTAPAVQLRHQREQHGRGSPRHLPHFPRASIRRERQPLAVSRPAELDGGNGSLRRQLDARPKRNHASIDFLGGHHTLRANVPERRHESPDWRPGPGAVQLLRLRMAPALARVQGHTGRVPLPIVRDDIQHCRRSREPIYRGHVQ
uniref:Uncharacterized protein n=1 Tax=Photinus pyralis TaxID=7054 RepID=A0A1Y1MNK2_PHOPY